MPSLLHEALVALFENRPSLAPELLRDVLHQPLPAYDEIELKRADLSQILPTEYRADLVVLLRGGEPAFGIVVEVQLERDPGKRYTWPLYAIALRARYRCPACVLVVTPDTAVARWAARPIETGQPASPFTPLVLGPGAVPRVTDIEQARAAPELAVLSVQAHGKAEHGVKVAVAALAAASTLDDERATFYCDLVYLAVSDAARAALEELMQSGQYEYQSEFARRYIAEGKAEGRAEGKAEGKAEDLLKIMALRGLVVSGEQRRRVLACTDLATLDGWIERAVCAETTAAVFGEASDE